MPFLARVTVYPDHGAFRPDSFRDLLQAHIQLPGLDQEWTHTLVDVAVPEDGAHAELTVHSEPPPARPLHAALRIVSTTPAAHVRVHDSDGQVLHEGSHSAPLRLGQIVDIAGGRYIVDATTWPGRHPDTGACAGDIDWQHATVRRLPPIEAAPTAAAP